MIEKWNLFSNKKVKYSIIWIILLIILAFYYSNWKEGECIQYFREKWITVDSVSINWNTCSAKYFLNTWNIKQLNVKTIQLKN